MGDSNMEKTGEGRRLKSCSQQEDLKNLPEKQYLRNLRNFTFILTSISFPWEFFKEQIVSGNVWENKRQIWEKYLGLNDRIYGVLDMEHEAGWKLRDNLNSSILGKITIIEFLRSWLGENDNKFDIGHVKFWVLLGI